MKYNVVFMESSNELKCINDLMFVFNIFKSVDKCLLILKLVYWIFYIFVRLSVVCVKCSYVMLVVVCEEVIFFLM